MFISTYIYQSNEKDPRLTLQWYAGGMIVDNGVLEKKCQTPGKKKYILELEKQFKAPTVMWSPGPLVFYSFGVVLWSLGTLVLWYEVLWCFMFYLMPGCSKCKYCRNANLLVHVGSKSCRYRANGYHASETVIVIPPHSKYHAKCDAN